MWIKKQLKFLEDIIQYWVLKYTYFVNGEIKKKIEQKKTVCNRTNPIKTMSFDILFKLYVSICILTFSYGIHETNRPPIIKIQNSAYTLKIDYFCSFSN